MMQDQPHRANQPIALSTPQVTHLVDQMLYVQLVKLALPQQINHLV
jgi:hypothetical protein